MTSLCATDDDFPFVPAPAEMRGASVRSAETVRPNTVARDPGPTAGPGVPAHLASTTPARQQVLPQGSLGSRRRCRRRRAASAPDNQGGPACHHTAHRSTRPAHWDRITLRLARRPGVGGRGRAARADGCAHAGRVTGDGRGRRGAARRTTRSPRRSTGRRTSFFDAEVAAVLDWALVTLVAPTPRHGSSPAAAARPRVAGGLTWVVGKANGLFDGEPAAGGRPARARAGAARCAGCGLRLAPVVGRGSPVVAPRPLRSPRPDWVRRARAADAGHPPSR